MNKIERLAELEHIQWSCWTSYMLDNLTEENITRWRRQIRTPYVDLTETEKDSDREWAERVLEIIENKPIEVILDKNKKNDDNYFMEIDYAIKEDIEKKLVKRTVSKIINEIVECIIWSKLR